MPRLVQTACAIETMLYASWVRRDGFLCYPIGTSPVGAETLATGFDCSDLWRIGGEIMLIAPFSDGFVQRGKFGWLTRPEASDLALGGSGLRLAGHTPGIRQTGRDGSTTVYGNHGFQYVS